jgi:predicted Co/Zn/Cd cation transporter (cation efflux family)
MPVELDEQCTLMSAAILVAFVMIAWDMMITPQATLAPPRAPAPRPPS